MKFVPEPTARKRIMWCGPYALAVVSRQSYDVTYKRTLRRMNYKRRYKRKVIRGMHEADLWRALKTFKLTYRDAYKSGDKAQTLKQALEHLRPNRVYIVTLTQHFIVVDTHDWTTIDNWTREWSPLADSPHLRKRVERAIEIKRYTGKDKTL